jgi:hypothetical protein
MRFPYQAEAIAGDKHKAEDGLNAIEALNLPLFSASIAAASQPADGAGPSQPPPAAGNTAVKLGHKEREAALDDMTADGWLVHDDDRSKFWLGPRAFLELSNYLLDSAAEDVRELWATRV